MSSILRLLSDHLMTAVLFMCTALFLTLEVFMTYPTLHITKGPGSRDLEQAFLARDLGAIAKFTVFAEGYKPLIIGLKILNFNFVTCHGPNYKIGGLPVNLVNIDREFLPRFNFIFVEYNSEQREGIMTFSNAE